MIYSFFWDVTQHRLVVTDVSGQPIGPISDCLILDCDPRNVSTIRFLINSRVWRIFTGSFVWQCFETSGISHPTTRQHVPEDRHYVRPLRIALDTRNYDRTTANCPQTWPSANRCRSALQPQFNLLLLTASTVLLWGLTVCTKLHFPHICRAIWYAGN